MNAADRYLAAREVGRVLTQIVDGPERDALALQAMTGARVGEIAALRASDFDEPTRTLRLTGADDERGRRGKTGERRFPLPAEGVDLVRRLVGACPDGRLFDLPHDAALALNRALAVGCEAAKVHRFSTHGLRRMVALRLLDAGVDAKTASQITGHSVATLLKTYVRPDADRRRQAVARAGLGTLEPQGRVIRLAVSGAQDPGTTGDDEG